MAIRKAIALFLLAASAFGQGAPDAFHQAARAEGNIGGLSDRVTILTKDGMVKF
jgi:hypothetical protein